MIEMKIKTIKVFHECKFNEKGYIEVQLLKTGDLASGYCKQCDAELVRINKWGKIKWVKKLNLKL